MTWWMRDDLAGWLALAACFGFLWPAWVLLLTYQRRDLGYYVGLAFHAAALLSLAVALGIWR